MFEEDFLIDTPTEPFPVAPKASMISFKTSFASNKGEDNQRLVLLNMISNGKFPILLTYLKDQELYCAMKLFSVHQDKENISFQNEIRFASLCHPNIIRTISYKENKKIEGDGYSMTASVILTEFAPYGDFFDFLISNKKVFHETLVRTYFRQLIEGLEYLHQKRIGHLDLKLDNLLLGQDYALKIADFDLSCFETDSLIMAKGSENYRAPEVINGSCQNIFSADIYSAGIILFVMNNKGVIPHPENHKSRKINLYDLLQNQNEKFWEMHCKIQSKVASDFSQDFKDLFNGMTRERVEERFTLREIKNFKWYNGPVMTTGELKICLEPVVKIRNIFSN